MPPRSLLIDALKLLASQLIVLHHIVLYAPMAALVAPSRPALAGLLANEARWAVQIFLVVGGFLCAQALSLYRPSLPQLPRALLGRWLRLVPVLAVALLCVLAASALLPSSASRRSSAGAIGSPASRMRPCARWVAARQMPAWSVGAGCRARASFQRSRNFCWLITW